MKRRLQTAAVLFHEFTIPLYISLFWFVLAIPLTWPVLVPYLLYCLFSNAHVNGSSPQRRSHFLRRLPLWRLYTGYFPMQLHKSVDLDPQRNYIFTYHPHGIISHGAFGHFCTERTTGFETLFPGITNTLLTLDTNFRVPFYRDYLLSMGLASVSRRSCEALLRAAPAGRAITIVLGGAQESLEAAPGRMALIVKRRRGFLKIAIRENAGVVPVLSFGENELYEQMVPLDGGLLQWVQRALKRVAGFTVPLFHARGVFNYDVGLMPYRRAVNTVGRTPFFFLFSSSYSRMNEREGADSAQLGARCSRDSAWTTRETTTSTSCKDATWPSCSASGRHTKTSTRASAYRGRRAS